METENRFNLTAAIDNWRTELVAQADLGDEVRRELETHLRDSIAGFQQRGLTNEESFWLARRRVGQPQQLSVEFVKANPAAVWRERGLWMSAALLVVFTWNATIRVMSKLTANTMEQVMTRWGGHHWYWPASSEGSLAGVLFSILQALPLIVAAIFLIRQPRGGWNLSRLGFIFRSRAWFLVFVGAWLAIQILLLASWSPVVTRTGARNGSEIFILLNLVFGSIWPLGLIALTAWLIPANPPKRKKRA